MSSVVVELDIDAELGTYADWSVAPSDGYEATLPAQSIPAPPCVTTVQWRVDRRVEVVAVIVLRDGRPVDVCLLRGMATWRLRAGDQLVVSLTVTISP